MTLYHGGARIPAGYGADAAASTVPAATFDWSAFGAGLADVTKSGLEAYQSITAMQLASKATLQAQKLAYQQALALAKAQGTTQKQWRERGLPGTGAGSEAPCGSRRCRKSSTARCSARSGAGRAGFGDGGACVWAA